MSISEEIKINIAYCFENIIARSYAGSKNKNEKIEISKVEEIYIVTSNENKTTIVGKTSEVYFLLNHTNDNGYEYSTVMMHHNPIELLLHYKEKETILSGYSPEKYWEKLLLNKKLTENLKKEEKMTKKVFKI